MAENRHIIKRSSRNVIDVIDIQRSFINVQKSHHRSKSNVIKGAIFPVGSVLAFVMLGYAIAALSIPIWAKVTIFVFIALIGFIPGYLVSTLFH